VREEGRPRGRGGRLARLMTVWAAGPRRGDRLCRAVLGVGASAQPVWWRNSFTSAEWNELAVAGGDYRNDVCQVLQGEPPGLDQTVTETGVSRRRRLGGCLLLLSWLSRIGKSTAAVVETGVPPDSRGGESPTSARALVESGSSRAIYGSSGVYRGGPTRAEVKTWNWIRA